MAPAPAPAPSPAHSPAASSQQQLPAHVSPTLVASPTPNPLPLPLRTRVSDFPAPTSAGVGEDEGAGSPALPALISPAFTPPSTPGLPSDVAVHDGDGDRDDGEQQRRRQSQHRQRPPRRSGVSSSVAPPLQPHPKLLDTLPAVTCIVRARIPTTGGQEMFLHLYQNSVDDKEHLAIVFGPHIRSRSLDAPRPGETEMDRMIRGAYAGRLYPGRTTSGVVGAAVAGKDPDTHAPRLETQPPGAGAGESTALSSRAASPRPTDPPLVRVHSECYTGETVWSARCDCGEQLDEAARLMSLPLLAAGGGAESSTSDTDSCSNLAVAPDANAGPGGVIIYLRQEGRGIGLGEKLKAYNLQDLGSDTVEANLLLRHPADARSYGLATAMLVDLGLGGDTGIRLLTNNPDKIRAVEGRGREVQVKERVAMVPLAWRTQGREGIRSTEVGSYLRTKIEKMGHMMQM